MKKGKFTISKFVCPECGGEFPLPRQISKARGKNHIKDLWCPYCKKIVKTREYRSGDFYKTMDGKVIY